MKHFRLAMSLLALCSAFCPVLFAEEPVRERIEWVNIWITDAEKHDLPRVLLVGDSITQGYFGTVEQQLAGKAYCARLTTSKCVSDPSFNDDLQALLKQYKFAVIHFNNGLHGWGYSEDQYARGLSDSIAALKHSAGDARIIWASTTPMRNTSDLQMFSEQTPRVIARNALAAEIMQKHELPTDDLFELVKDHPEWQSKDGVHFNADGNAALGTQVAKQILPLLPQ